MDDHLNSRYEADALIWTDTQIALLRAGKFDQLDVENIISELAYQVRKDKREVATRIRRKMPTPKPSGMRPKQHICRSRPSHRRSHTPPTNYLTAVFIPAKTKKPLNLNGINGFRIWLRGQDLNL
jgi:hypothetical protein|nr:MULTISPECIES: DUF29 family protein [unclassified Duganella]